MPWVHELLSFQTLHMLLSLPWTFPPYPFCLGLALVSPFCPSLPLIPLEVSFGCSSNTLCMALSPPPSNCHLREYWIFCVSPWGSHRVKNGDYWPYCPGTKIVPDTEVLSECLWRKSISWAPVFSSWKTKYGKLNEFFMSDFDWWL